MAREDLQFQGYTLSVSDRVLYRGTQVVSLRRKAFDVLLLLLRHAPRVVPKEDLMLAGWRGEQRCENSLHQTVKEIRRALNGTGQRTSLIQTVSGRGYRFTAEVKGGLTDADASGEYETLLRTGWHHWRRRSKEGFEAALEWFEFATAKTPNLSAAYEAIGKTHLMLATYGMHRPSHAQAAFRQALRINGWTPSLLVDQAHALHIFERRRCEAESILVGALKQHPTNVQGWVSLGLLLAAGGRPGEALAVWAELRRIEPLYPNLPTLETFTHFCAKDFDSAISCGRTAIQFDPYLHLGRSFYAQALEFSGLKAQALEQHRLACQFSPEISWLRALLAACLARAGQSGEAEEILNDLHCTRTRDYVDSYYMALLLEALGRRDQAISELGQAVAENSATLFILDVDPKMDNLRGDPRFASIREVVFRESASGVVLHGKTHSQS